MSLVTPEFGRSGEGLSRTHCSGSGHGHRRGGGIQAGCRSISRVLPAADGDIDGIRGRPVRLEHDSGLGCAACAMNHGVREKLGCVSR